MSASLKLALYGAGAEYALHSLLVMSTRTEPVSVGDLAGYLKIPARFLAKIFSRLKRAGLVTGKEGIAGGFSLSRRPEQIQVLQVLQAVDAGRTLFACAEIRRNCLLFGDAPPDWAVGGPCRIHALMQEAEEKLHEFLASKSIADLASEFERKAPAKFKQATAVWFEQRMAARRPTNSLTTLNPTRLLEKEKGKQKIR